MNFQIKQAEPDRIDEYMEIMADSSLYEHYFMGDEERLENNLSTAARDGKLYIAETSSGEAVGLMICEWKGMFGDWPYLSLLGVKKAYRGMGIGSALLDTFEAVSRAIGARNIFICVSHFNPRARALYMSKGYRKIALIPNLYKDNINENMLMKRLI